MHYKCTVDVVKYCCTSSSWSERFSFLLAACQTMTTRFPALHTSASEVFDKRLAIVIDSDAAGLSVVLQWHFVVSNDDGGGGGGAGTTVCDVMSVIVACTFATAA